MFDIFTNESFLFLLIINIIAAVGMNVVYMSGQLNLGQAGFMAIGAYTTALTDNLLGWPLVPSLLASAIIASIIAYPVAWGASRFKGVYLIMGSMAVGEIVRVVIGNVDALGGLQGYFGITPITLPQISLILVVILLLAGMLMLSPFALRVRAVFDDEDTAAITGVPVRQVKILSVVLSAAIVGIAGGLLAKWLLFVAPRNFGLDLSFRIALFTLIGGVHSLLGAVVGAFSITYLLEMLRYLGGISTLPEAIRILGDWRQVIYGFTIIALMIVRPEGLINRQLSLTLTKPFRGWWRNHNPFPATSSSNSAAPIRPTKNNHRLLLEIKNIGHRFGGVQALQDVSLDVYEGEILAIIGANGAGKSTLVKLITGQYPTQKGTFLLNSQDINALTSWQRARHGISLTSQSIRMLHHLTVEENLHLGRLSKGDRTPLSTDAILKLLHLENSADALPGALSLTEQRWLEIGRAIASAPSVLFLDEPSAGMNEVERQELAEIILKLREMGITIVLIDHNLDLIFDLAERIAVIDLGELIALGKPEEIVINPKVRGAYLGTIEGSSS